MNVKTVLNHPDGYTPGINGLKAACLYKDWAVKIDKTFNYDNHGVWNDWYDGYTLKT